MLNEKSIQEFRAGLRGSLVEPGDPGYDEACKVNNGMIHKHPRIFAYCSDVADVITSVNFARDNNFPFSVRGGGHNGAGLGLIDNGLVIDLSRIKYTRVDPKAKTIVVGGGCTWGDVDHAAHAFGLATPSGILSTTGVGGLTLGGGHGYLTRKYGLTIDNLLSVDIVLADSSFVTASPDLNQDLFWAVRGGGGNFGIVTAFTFRLHPVSMVYGGPIFYDISETEETLNWYQKLIKNAPDELNGFYAIQTVPPFPPFPEHLQLKKICGVVWAYSGPMEKAEEIFSPIRSFKKPALDFAGPMPYPALQSMFDSLLTPGLQWYWKGDFVNELNKEAIKKHIEFGLKAPTWMSGMHLYPVNGAASRISNKDTAWAFRNATWSMVIVGIDPDPGNGDKISAWAKQYWKAMHPYSAGGAYSNFMMEEGEERVKASFGDNYAQLVKIKDKYDPNNFFRINQNIKPTLAKTQVGSVL